MNDLEFQKRLTRAYKRKWWRSFWMRFVGAAVVVVTSSLLLAQMVYADPPSGADPSGATGFPYSAPAAVFTANGCSPQSSCPNVIWFAGDTCITGAGGCTARTNVTCVGVGSQVSHVGLDPNFSTYLFFGPSGNGLGGTVYCYQSGVWYPYPTSSTGLRHSTINGIIATNITIKTNAGYTSGGSPGYNPTGASAGTTLVSPNYTYTFGGVSLTATEEEIQAGEETTFTASWSDIGFTPYYLYFYESAEDAVPERLVQFYPLASPNGTYTWDHTYESEGNYAPIVSLGNINCATPTSSGCTLIESDGTPSIVVESTQQNDFDVLFPSTLSGSKINDVIVGQNVTFTYKINTSVCAPSTVSSRYFLKGYPNPISYKEANSGSGTPLNVNQGSITTTFTQTARPYSDFYYPRINVGCSNGFFKTLYLGSTWNISKAVGVSVYEASDSRFWIPDTWLNGGNTEDFSTSSGTLLETDKRVYAKYEPVKMQLVYHVPFAVSVAKIYSDPDLLPDVRTMTGSYTGMPFANNKTLYFQIEYTKSGIYQPMIQLRSSSYNPSDPSTFRNIYIGGESLPYAPYSLSITNENYGSTQFSNETGSGAQMGIFGLDPSTFAVSFGKTDNLFLGWAQSIVNYVVRAVLYVASYAYSALRQAPFFSFVGDIIHPREGTSKVLPNELFGVEISEQITDREFTIEYADPVTFAPMYTLMVMIIAFAVLRMLIHELL